MKIIHTLKKEWVKTYEAPKQKTEAIRFSLAKAHHNNQDIVRLKKVKRTNVGRINRMSDVRKKPDNPGFITFKNLEKNRE